MLDRKHRCHKAQCGARNAQRQWQPESFRLGSKEGESERRANACGAGHSGTFAQTAQQIQPPESDFPLTDKQPVAAAQSGGQYQAGARFEQSEAGAQSHHADRDGSRDGGCAQRWAHGAQRHQCGAAHHGGHGASQRAGSQSGHIDGTVPLLAVQEPDRWPREKQGPQCERPTEQGDRGGDPQKGLRDIAVCAGFPRKPGRRYRRKALQYQLVEHGDQAVCA